MDHDTAPPPGKDQRPAPHQYTLELRRHRAKANISQKKLARLSGVSEAWLRCLEQGCHQATTGWKRSLPNPEHTVRLAMVLDWNVDNAMRTAGHDPELAPHVELPSLDDRIGRLTPSQAAIVSRVLDYIEQPAAAS